MLNFVTVKFVWTDDQFNRYFKYTELRIRSQVVYDWIAVLIAVNPLYASLNIVNSPASAAPQLLDNLDQEICKRSQHISDPETINIEKVIGSDPADVRWYVSDEVSTGFSTLSS